MGQPVAQTNFWRRKSGSRFRRFSYIIGQKQPKSNLSNRVPQFVIIFFVCFTGDDKRAGTSSLTILQGIILPFELSRDLPRDPGASFCKENLGIVSCVNFLIYLDIFCIFCSKTLTSSIQKQFFTILEVFSLKLRLLSYYISRN